jgi:hypothetical protein
MFPNKSVFLPYQITLFFIGGVVMVFNTTFNNIQLFRGGQFY